MHAEFSSLQTGYETVLLELSELLPPVNAFPYNVLYLNKGFFPFWTDAAAFELQQRLLSRIGTSTRFAANRMRLVVPKANSTISHGGCGTALLCVELGWSTRGVRFLGRLGQSQVYDYIRQFSHPASIDA
jgi:hypothetical protein